MMCEIAKKIISFRIHRIDSLSNFKVQKVSLSNFTQIYYRAVDAQKIDKILKFHKFSSLFNSKHYERRLVRNAFGEWLDMWWVARKEWGLSVRADLHNRYVHMKLTMMEFYMYILVN